MKQVVNVEQTLIDDLSLLHGINAIEEINKAVKSMGFEPEINITNNGDFLESQSIKE